MACNFFFLTLTASILLVLGQFVNLTRDHVREKNYNMKQNLIETLMDKDFQIYLFSHQLKQELQLTLFIWIVSCSLHAFGLY